MTFCRRATTPAYGTKADPYRWPTHSTKSRHGATKRLSRASAGLHRTDTARSSNVGPDAGLSPVSTALERPTPAYGSSIAATAVYERGAGFDRTGRGDRHRHQAGLELGVDLLGPVENAQGAPGRRGSRTACRHATARWRRCMCASCGPVSATHRGSCGIVHPQRTLPFHALTFDRSGLLCVTVKVPLPVSDARSPDPRPGTTCHVPGAPALRSWTS